MAEILPIEKVKLFCGIIAQSEELITLALEDLTTIAGSIDSESDIIPFDFTDYYRAEMGSGLLRKFAGFADLIDPAKLVDMKLQTNAIEAKYGSVVSGKLTRKMNLDPGYLNASRLILATTKDFSHRIYLDKGIYAEITMNFDRNGPIYHPWTYPDFKSAPYREFFLTLRQNFLLSRNNN